MVLVIGHGYQAYRDAYHARRIQSGDHLFVRNLSIEHYLIKDLNKFDWVNKFNRKKAENQTVKQILFRRRWVASPDVNNMGKVAGLLKLVF